MKDTRAITKAESIKQMEIALKAYHPRFFLLWEIGIQTGLRISDLLTLKTSCFSSNGCFTIKESKTGKSKKCKLTPELMKEIKQYVKQFYMGYDDYLFYSCATRRNVPMSRQWAHHIIARTARNLRFKRIGAHSMRKIYACNLFRATRSLDAVQAALNHKYPSTTLMYLKDLFESLVFPA